MKMPERFKILVGYDGSEYAETALNDLATAGLPDQAEAFVATIAEMWIQGPLGYGGVETSFADEVFTNRSQAREAAAEGAEKLIKMFPNWTVEYDGEVGSPSEILLSKADESKPDLIVVGSQSHGVIGRFFFGSVAQSLVQNARCSVRVARKPNTAERKGAEAARIIVGVDGSIGADAAVDSIISRSWASGVEICVVSAMDYVIPLKQFDLIEPTGLPHSEYYRREFEKADQAVNRAINKLDQAGFHTISVIRNQDPKNLLIEQAIEWKADCIFVGAKGKSRIERLMIGSVSSSVAARAACSVEVVRKQD
jgi:nucleotide-binding universal stress UspA family protein